MDMSSERRKPLRSLDTLKTLNAHVERIIVVRRGVIADLRAIEDRVRRLGLDIRRFLSGRPSGYGQLSSRILTATERQRRLVSFEGVSEVTKEEMLRVFLDAVNFAREARGVLAFCERVVRKWGFLCSSRDGECFGEIREALRRFPGLGFEYRDERGGRNLEQSRFRERGMVTEDDILQKLVDEVEVVPFRAEGVLRWRCCSAYG
ncbi:hypothetical protein F4803DRAFT_472517 [Xylaria telfairii]|nr:hypothetical protein F4803DRAFT_472517 [Xylaria telfairii]